MLAAVLREGAREIIAGRRIATEAEREMKDLPGYVMEIQRVDQWCWAAVAMSVAKFYNEATKWANQCDVANAVLNRDDCCSNPAACNEMSYLETVLPLIGHLKKTVARPLEFDELAREIDAGRPVPIRVAWDGGRAHFLVVIGYDRAQKTLTLRDPFFGHSRVSVDVLHSGYQGRSYWTHSYLTQPRGRQRAVRK